MSFFRRAAIRESYIEAHTLEAGALSELIASSFDCCRARPEPRVVDVFRSILVAANEYVPSECGSVALGNPEESEGELVFVASFGTHSARIPGKRVPKSQGIAGKVYRAGRPCIRNRARSDRAFYSRIDELVDFQTESIMAVPIQLGSRVCGVLSLINRLDKRGFRRRDLRLVEIFSRYLSTSIQGLIDFQFQQELAVRDHLSGLFNDRHFHELLIDRIADADRQGSELALLFLDLDHFKSVVDEHGHQVGGRVLAEVGQLLKALVDDESAILARYGGDEYVVLLPQVGHDPAVELAQKLRRAVGRHTYLTTPSPDGGPALNICGRFTASIGVASLGDCDCNPRDINQRRHSFVRMADEAMYAAKAAGKDRVVSAPRGLA